MKLSIIIPAYNEEGKVAKTIKNAYETLGKFIDLEIIAVNDGSTDNTENELNSLTKRYKALKIVSYKKNRGKGHAIKQGSKFVTGDYVAFLDADGDISPRHLIKFVEVADKTNADIISGSKYHPLASNNFPFSRKFLSRGYNLLVKLLFNLPVTDTQAGIKLFKTSALEKLAKRMVVKRFAFDLELLVIANKLGMKIIEVPVRINFSRLKSRIGAKDIKNIIQDTFAIAYRLYIKRCY